MPITEATRHLIGAHELARMKSSAILVEMGRIRAAGLDVFEREPLSPESPLPHMPNVVALPHIGSATHETRDAMAQRAVDNLGLALRGERPISLVNEAVWESRRAH